MDRLFGRPRITDEQKRRLPPGQYLTEKWPVLHYGSVPRVDLATWDFKVWGEVGQPIDLSWEQFQALPRKTVHTDIHCVTRWTKLDTDFEGVAPRTVLDLVRPTSSARFVVAHCEQGYTTNLPLDALLDDDVLLADTYAGEPLEPEHGYPLRLMVPKRYFWKSAKWIRGLQLLDHDVPGFWERYGYHNEGDPWLEERFSEEGRQERA
ncbi:MAG: sulfite oxidase-like oxidoreductase [Chloroflexi bacterium]|nr:sulfite oxidase-like oxidoreductase [Chloroflexota bacterium]